MNQKWLVSGLAMGLALSGCGEKLPAAPPEFEATAAKAPERVEVSGEAALKEVRQFVELGPRDSGTPGAEKAANYLYARLKEIGVEAEIQEFREASPKGEVVFRNVLGRIPGGDGKIVLLGSHYDTKAGIENFEGANDSGSSTGLLLELARGFSKGAPHAMEIRFAFFDGEECMEEYGPGDGFHGSEHLAEAMEADGSLKRIAAMILLDMVGDRDLSVTIPRNGTPELVSLAFEAARREGVRNRFRLYPSSIGDDHVAFFRRGVPAVNLIDFEFGSAPGKNDYWHTPQDTLDKVSSESLETVGRVVARMVEEIARRESAAKK